MYGDENYTVHWDVDERTGYPEAWELVKHEVRNAADDRCVRCGHPYKVGQESFWSEPTVEGSVQEVAALSLFATEPTDEPRVKRERPVHWSPCDELCVHGGLVRVRGSVGLGQPEQWIVRDWGTEAVPASWRPVQAAWRILTVHHADGDKKNLLWWNLLALCQRCHLSVQSRVQMGRVWPHEHSDWFKPYAAGFYARMYLKVDLTRDETMARLEELLALERATA